MFRHIDAQSLAGLATAFTALLLAFDVVTEKQAAAIAAFLIAAYTVCSQAYRNRDAALKTEMARMIDRDLNGDSGLNH